ncbi:MAG: ABC transporter ATP-binding protein/permease [Acetobacteraceae bacterium]|nr:ABC transporter ATP-binding protein/permease [Acetobacteraceae bacterium]
MPATDPTPHAASAEDDVPPPAPQEPFFRAFLRFAILHFLGRAGARPRLVGLGLVLLTVAQVALMVRLNVWHGDLFNALERRSPEAILRQVGMFALLLAGMMLANGAHLQLKRDLQLGWRSWLTRRLTERWLSDGRHYALSQLASEHATNPDGRIAEDIRISAEYAVDLATTLFHALLLLIAFLSVLWALSGIVNLPLPWLEQGLAVPGHMVALAILYAAGGSVLAFRLGRPLVSVTDERQGREADFRFALSQVRENAEPLAMARAEPVARARLTGLFGRIVDVWARQTRTLRDLLLFSVGYGQLAPILPLLVASPRYLAGTLTLGGLVQIAQAFQQVVAALSWPVDNAQRLAEWRASAERVLALRSAIATLDEGGRTSLGGEMLRGGGLVLDALVVQNPDGTPATGLLFERFKPGEAVRLDGDPRAVSLLCKAIAGHWRWGEGAIRMPEDVVPAICTPDPWLPAAPLRDILGGAPGAGDDVLTAALDRVGLPELAARLDVVEPWHERLDEGARQRLMIARLMVRRPGIIVLDQALRTLSGEEGCALLAALREVIPAAVILVAGSPEACADRFDRVVSLHVGQGGRPRSVAMPRSSRLVDLIGQSVPTRQ